MAEGAAATATAADGESSAFRRGFCSALLAVVAATEGEDALLAGANEGREWDVDSLEQVLIELASGTTTMTTTTTTTTTSTDGGEATHDAMAITSATTTRAASTSTIARRRRARRPRPRACCSCPRPTSRTTWARARCGRGPTSGRRRRRSCRPSSCRRPRRARPRSGRRRRRRRGARRRRPWPREFVARVRIPARRRRDPTTYHAGPRPQTAERPAGQLGLSSNSCTEAKNEETLDEDARRARC